MNKKILLFSCAALMLLVGLAFAEETLLLRQPSISADHVVFVYANDLWVAPITGGEATRLTTHIGSESTPYFSPDGSTIAFTAQYDGNTDVFVVPVNGGTPERLTYHPAGAGVRGWTNDGSRILFSSGRDNLPVQLPRLWTVATDGSMPTMVPLPEANYGSFSPDGKKMAYVKFDQPYHTWRKYRGGRQTNIRVIDLETYDSRVIPKESGNDYYPMWVGNQVYFISDREGTFNLYSYDVESEAVAKLTDHQDYDIKYASANNGKIVYQQAGAIHVFDPATNTANRLSITVNGDLPWRRPHFARVGDQIRSYNISPTGARAVFEARGEIFTVPAKKGDFRNLSNSPAVHDRSPAWSPDGKWIAWFSDKGGEYGLMIRDQKGLEDVRRIELENPSFYYELRWSPDSKKVLFYDKHLNLYYMDIESGSVTNIDTDTYSHPVRTLSPQWSPDSKWITYSKRLDNHLHAILLYSLDKAETYQITDGMSDAISPVFDKGGKYLYFLASTDYALNTGWLDMSSYDRPVQRGVYLVVLSKDESSPFLPESDDEAVKEEKTEEPAAEEKGKEGKEEKAKDDDSLKINLEGIDQRILAVDIPLRDYQSIHAGSENIFFYTEAVPNGRGVELHRYSISEQEGKPFMSGIFGLDISADGKKLLYSAGRSFGIVPTGNGAKVGQGSIDTASLEMKIVPREEWKQIYHEAWRINRDFFYDANMHGADWDAVYKKYEPFLDHIGHRSDLNEIIASLISEVVVGHAFYGGGDQPYADRVPVGLLGADYEIKDGYYSFAHIYSGENWNPGLRAPLTAPGVNVNIGDYLLEVNGRKITSDDNIYQVFAATAGKQVFIRVNDKPTLEDSRLVTVVPVASEYTLRNRAWIEENRRKVDELSDGKLAYIYLPNTAGAGYTNFNRYYFSQQHKHGAILDERWNGGGSAADYIIDLLDRDIMNYWATRDGKVFRTPTAAMYGPKVMIVNEYSSSGGDAMPYYFKKKEIGQLVGKTTWGGLVGIYDYPVLMDGGRVTAPRVAIYSTDGEWVVENEGVSPHIEVDQDPKLVMEGHDPQLEKAVEVALKMLEENPVVFTPRPAPIDRVKQ